MAWHPVGGNNAAGEITMTTISVVAVPNGQIAVFIRRYWNAFQERRERQKVRAALYGLNACDLRDIGITPGEIDYVALNRSVDPRGAASVLK
jgi:uncharacterized protein YjiS (DUF1127 family)